MARSILDALLEEPERMGARTQSIKPQGTLANPGIASPLGPTLSMKTGAFLHPLLQAAKDKFPKDNPRGRWLGEMLLGDSPQRTGRVAEGIPDQYFHYNRGSGSNVSPEIVDLAAALPIGSAFKLAKLAAPLAAPVAMATSAAALNRLKAPGYAATSTDDIGAALLGRSLGNLDDAMVGGDAGAAALARIGNTAPQQAMELAEQMESAGRSRDEIWAATADMGYPVFRGKDGQLRFEIEDTQSFLESPGFAPSGYEILQHPGIQDAYPPMWNALQQSISKGPYGGHYANKTIRAQAPSRTERQSVALHELQHATQEAEGFARGGDPDAPYRSGELDQLIQRKYEQIKTLPGNAGETKAALYNHAKKLVNSYEGKYEAYRQLAGETEARAVQKRMDMTPEERAAKPFYADFDVPEADQIVRRYGDGPSAMVSYDDPADKFMEQINEARNKGQSIFVRWSPTSERDLEPGRVSRDFVSGDTHAGLSGIEITPDMDDETIARRISEYGFGRMQSPDSVPRIYYGEKVGTDSDGYQSFIPSGLALEADKDVISSLDRGYAKKKTLSEEIARNRNSLARLTERGDENSIGYDIVRESLEKNEKELSKVLKRNDETIAEPSVDEFVGKLLDEGTSQTGIEAGGAVSARTAPTNSSSGESTDLNKTLASKEMYIPFGNKQVNVIQNPTAQEYADFRQTVKAELIEKYGDNGASGPVTRKTMDANGNTWVWSADDAVHGDMEPEISKITGREVNQNVDMLTAKANALSDETMPTASVDEFIGGLLDDELPLDEASRMHEATFGEDLYHGTVADIDEFEVSDLGVHLGTQDAANVRLSDKEATRSGVSRYKTRNQDFGESANILPVRTSAQNPLRMDDAGEWRDPSSVITELRTSELMSKNPKLHERLLDMQDEADKLHESYAFGDLGSEGWYESPEAAEMLDEIRKMIEAEGYDSIKYTNFIESRGKNADSTIVLNPKNIRSKFAKFDPAKKDSANILAGAAGAGVLSGLYEPDALQDDEKMRRALLRN